MAVAKVENALRRRDTQVLLLAIAMLLSGMLLLLVGPSIVATIWWFGSGFPDWRALFWKSSLIVLPLLFVIQWWTQGHFTEDAVVEMADHPVILDTVGASGRATGLVIVLVTLGILGPGLIFGAIARLRSLWRHRLVDRSRAARIVAQLVVCERGIAVAQLVLGRELPGDLVPVLSFLSDRDWIGCSKDGHKAWLLSQARLSLA